MASYETLLKAFRATKRTHTIEGDALLSPAQSTEHLATPSLEPNAAMLALLDGAVPSKTPTD